jgi:hypothetical protein
MSKAKSLGFTAAFLILWVRLMAYPALHRHFDGQASRPEGQRLIESALFVPLLGAWALPESPILRFSPHDSCQNRPPRSYPQGRLAGTSR